MKEQEPKHITRKRVRELSALELDYTGLRSDLHHFAELAEKISGAAYALVNLLDEDYQWTVSESGMEINHMPIEKGLCRYTVQQKEPYEIRDFPEKGEYGDAIYAKEIPGLNYYLGIPLITSNNVVIGTICLLNSENLEIGTDKREQLKLIARGIIQLIEEQQSRQEFYRKVNQLVGYVKKVAHDVRNPIAAIISTADFIAEEEDPEGREELLKLIHESAESLLDFTDQQLQNILNQQTSKDSKTSLSDVIGKLNDLYQVQANYSNIELDFTCDPSLLSSDIPYSPGNLIHIIGNVVADSLKRTAEGGRVDVQLRPYHGDKGRFIKVSVIDTAPVLHGEELQEIKNSSLESFASGDEPGEETSAGVRDALFMLQAIDGYFTVDPNASGGNRVDLFLPVSSLIMNPLLKIAN